MTSKPARTLRRSTPRLHPGRSAAHPGLGERTARRSSGPHAPLGGLDGGVPGLGLDGPPARCPPPNWVKQVCRSMWQVAWASTARARRRRGSRQPGRRTARTRSTTGVRSCARPGPARRLPAAPPPPFAGAPAGRPGTRTRPPESPRPAPCPPPRRTPSGHRPQPAMCWSAPGRRRTPGSRPPAGAQE